LSKIEKTLELNITHEILLLADSFWWYLQPISLKKYWRPHWRFPFIEAPKSYALGLPTSLEGKAGGGYDVCITSPPIFQGGNARLLFMQFKAGIERQFNQDPNSIFFGSPLSPSIHVEFVINSNKNHNQHRLLKDIAKKAGNRNAAVYVFPLIVNTEQLNDNIGRLLKKTSFISIDDIDRIAGLHGITIDDGQSHKYRACYADPYKNEVNWEIEPIGKPDNPGGLLGEMFSIRMFRALQSLKRVQISKYQISKYHIMDAMIRHAFNIGLHFTISYSDCIKHFNELPRFLNRLKSVNELYDLPQPYQIGKTENQFVLDVFNDIMQSLSRYFKWIEETDSFEKTEIPKPPSECTIELIDKELRIEMPAQEQNPKYEAEDRMMIPTLLPHICDIRTFLSSMIPKSCSHHYEDSQRLSVHSVSM